MAADRGLQLSWAALAGVEAAGGRERGPVKRQRNRRRGRKFRPPASVAGKPASRASALRPARSGSLGGRLGDDAATGANEEGDWLAAMQARAAGQPGVARGEAMREPLLQQEIKGAIDRHGRGALARARRQLLDDLISAERAFPPSRARRKSRGAPESAPRAAAAGRNGDHARGRRRGWNAARTGHERKYKAPAPAMLIPLRRPDLAAGRANGAAPRDRMSEPHATLSEA